MALTAWPPIRRLAPNRRSQREPGATPWFLADWDPRLAEEAHAERGERPIPVSDLVRTLDRPVRAFVKDTLGLDLDERDTQVTDDEPVALGGLEEFHLAETLLASTGDQDDWRRAALGRQTGPVGTLGRVALARVERRVATLRAAEAAALRDIAGDDPAEGTLVEASRAVEVTVSDAGARWTLEARLSWREVADHAVLTVVHPAKAGNPAPLLRAWVHHLVATCVLDVPVVTVVVRLGKERGVTTDRFDAHLDRDDALRALARLCRIHDAAHLGPLPLLRHASSAFASTLQGAKGAGRRVRTVDEVDPLLVRVAREAARAAYEAERSGDRDAATGLVLGAVDLDEAIAPVGGWRAFESLALDVWGPVLAPAGAGAGGAR
jgi:exodeoxyribonuclease V gamma subunit